MMAPTTRPHAAWCRRGVLAVVLFAAVWSTAARTVPSAAAAAAAAAAGAAATATTSSTTSTSSRDTLPTAPPTWHAASGSGRVEADECMWLEYPRQDSIRAYELQAQPHRHMIRDRDRAIARVERLLRRLSADPASGVQFVPDSRTMAIFQETAFQVSTRHGHPLQPKDKKEAHSRPFPWKKLAYLRLRVYKLLTPAGAYVPSSMPGTADLTFKMKDLDPDRGPEGLQLPEQVGSAKLTAKIEWDGHCDHGRVSMSPLYRPVSQTLNISQASSVSAWFPNLAAVARLPSPDWKLPFMHEVHRAKVVWAVVFRGVIGEANLVIKYNTSFEDAVAGARPKNGELSLRIRRDVAEATGTEGSLWAALDAIGGAMQAFRDAGWDGKTPGLPTSSSSSSSSAAPARLSRRTAQA